MERTWPLRQQYAWLIVVVAWWIVSSFSSPLVDAVGPPAAVAIYLVGGVLLGGLWYFLNPRPLGERARAVGRLIAIYLGLVLALALVVTVVAVFQGGWSTDWSAPGPDVAALPGLPLGLWLAERRGERAVTRSPVLR